MICLCHSVIGCPVGFGFVLVLSAKKPSSNLMDFRLPVSEISTFQALFGVLPCFAIHRSKDAGVMLRSILVCLHSTSTWRASLSHVSGPHWLTALLQLETFKNPRGDR
jgi:hypothetical protein